MLGVSFVFVFVSFCAMLVVLVVSERRASACLIMLSAKQGNHWCHFNAFGMARPEIELTTPAPEADALPFALSGPVYLTTADALRNSDRFRIVQLLEK